MVCGVLPQVSGVDLLQRDVENTPQPAFAFVWLKFNRDRTNTRNLLKYLIVARRKSELKNGHEKCPDLS